MSILNGLYLKEERNVQVKIYKDCKANLSLSSFHRNKVLSDGRCVRCKECSKARRRAYNAKYPERMRKIQRRYRYNLTEDQYTRLESITNCQICNKSKEDCKVGLVIDHNHETSEVRGVLCSSCNKGLGFFKDNLRLLEQAAHYLDICKVRSSRESKQ